MASLSSLFSRWFGKPEEVEKELEAELRADPSPPPEPSPPPDPGLTLPPPDPVNKLWKLYCREKGSQPAPLLKLEARPDMTEADGRGMLFQLQVALNLPAKKRLERTQVKGKSGEEPALPVLDAQAVVFVPKDGLSAWLLLFPPVGGGEELSRDDLSGALDQAQVRFGVDEALLDRIPTDRNRYFRLFHVAEGALPVHGEDGKVEELFPRVNDRSFTVDEHNRADYTSLNLFHNVEEGGVICRIHPPTAGVPGRSVLDRELPARDGRPVSVPKGRNTHFSEEGDALLASIAGQVEFSGRSFQVKPLLDIPGDVDFSTGNINFVGDVFIHGDICAGFTVRAMGSITVDGVVMSSTVEAGGDLVVTRGVQGDNQAVIKAHRSVYAKYLENCCVCAKTGLYADCVINCDVYCDGIVEVRSGRMTIIGGTIRAAQEVSAGTIGSRTECRTGVILGGLPCGEFDYGVLSQEAAEIQDELKRLERQPDSPQKLSRISKLRVKLIVAQKKLAELDKEKELLAGEKAEPEAGGARRMVCDVVYPGTVLNIDGLTHHFDRKLQPCRASVFEDEIQLI